MDRRNAARAAPAIAGSDPRNIDSLTALDGSKFNDKRGQTQHKFHRITVENHVRLLHECAAGCEGVLVLTPIRVESTPRTQRFAIGDVAGMVAAVMAYDGVPGVNLYAQYGTMRRDLPLGKKGGEADVEAVFAAVADIDADKLTQREIPIEPSYVVESSPGNFQRVYIFPHPLPVSEVKPVLCAMHAAIGGDSAQKDCSHVWRIPGTLNWPTKSKLERGRSPEPVLARITSPWQGVFVDPRDLLALSPPVKPHGALRRLETPFACDERRLRSALSVIPSDDRDIWLRIGMACHSEGRRDAWDDWSRTSNKFDPVTQDRTWNSFRSGGITIGTIFYEAKMRGWK
jgi:Primase C terminal 2 (PriCT-2)/RepB DNA-primase from phage plasmid